MSASNDPDKALLRSGSDLATQCLARAQDIVEKQMPKASMDAKAAAASTLGASIMQFVIHNRGS
ncbi:hypothetical protein [Palleronia rufa]|uniref:hypothetical protein n=1 Tax=Palleronia rufa TaxID=1530186 RepID=UPI00055C8800|nr:hypothetical protein [Palleronia rufa]